MTKFYSKLKLLKVSFQGNRLSYYKICIQECLGACSCEESSRGGVDMGRGRQGELGKIGTQVDQNWQP